MRFIETTLPGVCLVELEPREDARGDFARTFCRKELEARGLPTTVAQCNTAFTHRRGTVRGIHYQVAPAAESKWIRCVRGSIYDVIVDVRPNSPTRYQHFGVELNAENRLQLFVPEGFAHGYQSLSEDVEVFYMVSEFYAPEYERGLRHDDPRLGIAWPLPVILVSEKDRNWPLLEA